MRTYLAAFIVASLAAALLTPLVRRLAIRWGVVSHPGGRHVHRAVVPRLGGIAIFVALVLPLAALFVVDSGVAVFVRAQSWKAAGMLLGAAVMCAVGVVDDTRGMRAVLKLAAQVAVAVFAFGCGLRIDAVNLPFVGSFSMGVFALPVTVLWITGIINAVNLIDGLDGLAAGVVLFAAVTNFVIANIAGSVFIAVVMAAMIGAVLGFLVFNFNPARIFMGDSGSYLLGYVMATSVLVGTTSQKASTAVSLLVPCLALGVPIFDTLFSMVRRLLERRPIFSADRGHIHHRLLDMGLTHRRAVLTIYAVSAVFSVAAVAAAMGTEWQVGVALLASSTVLFALVRAAGYFQYLSGHLRRKGRSVSPRAEAVRRAIPPLAERLAAASDESQVRAAVDGLRIADRVAIVAREPASGGGSRRPNSARPRGAEMLEASFPLGPEAAAHADVVFAWSDSEGAATHELDVLLEVLVDLVEHALVRVGSPLAATPAPAPAQSSAPRAAPVGVSPSTLGSRLT